MVAKLKDFLGIGMYTPAEAAMYARISTRTMGRWVHGDGSGAAAIQAQVLDAPDKTISFLDFVQIHALRAIREQETVSLQKIRQAIDFATSKGVTYPFARKHTTYFFNDEILIDVEGFGLIQASGRARGQFAMKPIVEMYLQDLSFNAEGLAHQYVAYEHRDGRIVMQPEYRLGEPVVESCGYTAWTLWKACLSEGSVQAAAEAYGVKEAEVRVAYKYIDSIRPATAA